MHSVISLESCVSRKSVYTVHTEFAPLYHVYKYESVVTFTNDGVPIGVPVTTVPAQGIC